MEGQLDKVFLLMQHKRYQDAKILLSELMAQDANNSFYFKLLAEINYQEDDYIKALELINTAIGIDPGNSDFYHTKARILLQNNQVKEAENTIQEAITLYPFDADYFALDSYIKMNLKKYNEALELADRALSIDAENIFALNQRSAALVKLNRKEESFETIEGALREDPNNAYTHANYGWGLLEKGEHKKAQEHFKQALSNDPNYGYAQSGILEAIKATNPLYRLYLRYAFFMNKLSGKGQWMFMIAFFFGTRLIRSIANANPTLAPFLYPIVIVLTIFAFSTWIIEPIGNLFLLFNSYGKHLLDKKEKLSAILVFISLVICLTGITLMFAVNITNFIPLAIFGFCMMPILGTMFTESRYKNAPLIYAFVMAIIGTIGLLQHFIIGEINPLIMLSFIIGFIAYQWIINAIIIK